MPDRRVVVHSLRTTDGAILDEEDQTKDVIDDKEHVSHDLNDIYI